MFHNNDCCASSTDTSCTREMFDEPGVVNVALTQWRDKDVEICLAF